MTTKKVIQETKGMTVEAGVKATPIVLTKGLIKVGVSNGLTLNMGNYESARIDVSLERVVEDNEETISETLKNLTSIIEEKLTEQKRDLDEIRG